MLSVKHRHFKFGLAIAVLTAALLLVLPATAAFAKSQPTGEIMGQVTDRATGDPVEGIRVDALLPSGAELDSACSFTDASGYYDISELAAGTYRVLFQDGSGYYGFQYYKNKWTFASSTVVTLHKGTVRTGIDAALVEAAHITGTVTDKATGEPVADVRVDALLPNGSTLSSLQAFTDSSGYYDVGGLAGGTYRVAFVDESGYYAREYSDNKPILGLAGKLTLGAGASADGVDAALVEAESDAPVTTDDAPTGWLSEGANVTLSSSDEGSGVFGTFYRLNGGAVRTYSGPIAMFGQGMNTLEYWSVDWAGNVEAANKAAFVVFAPPASNGTPSTPSTPSSVKHGVAFTTFGCIAKHAAGSSPVALQFYRSEHGRWVLRKTTAAKASGIAGFGFSKYSDSTSLGLSGQWRVRAVHKAGSHKLFSGYRTFTVS
jgi:5-hydroxyisourate hydrolase-like protein (transthyretin family)